MSQLSEKEILSDALSAQKATTALFNHPQMNVCTKM